MRFPNFTEEQYFSLNDEEKIDLARNVLNMLKNKNVSLIEELNRATKDENYMFCDLITNMIKINNQDAV